MFIDYTFLPLSDFQIYIYIYFKNPKVNGTGVTCFFFNSNEITLWMGWSDITLSLFHTVTDNMKAISVPKWQLTGSPVLQLLPSASSAQEWGHSVFLSPNYLSKRNQNSYNMHQSLYLKHTHQKKNHKLNYFIVVKCMD